MVTLVSVVATTIVLEFLLLLLLVGGGDVSGSILITEVVVGDLLVAMTCTSRSQT